MGNDKNFEVLDELNEKLSSIDRSLKVILCCTLLPKDGPNWDFYESLFRSAEQMVHLPGDLSSMVKEILLADSMGNDSGQH